MKTKKILLIATSVLLLLLPLNISAEGWRSRVWPKTPEGFLRPDPTPDPDPIPDPDPDPQPVPKLSGWIIVVDPGHGGSDSGAVNNDLNLKEKDIVLTIGLKLKSSLEVLGATVKMTREGNDTLSLSARYQLANNLNAHRFISLHNNSASINTAEGIETWVDADAGQIWLDYATSLHSNTVKAAKTYYNVKDRKIKLSGTTPPWNGKKITVINYSYIKCPAALLELNFINNNTEANRLIRSEYQNLLVEGMSQGFIEHATYYQKEAGLRR